MLLVAGQEERLLCVAGWEACCLVKMEEDELWKNCCSSTSIRNRRGNWCRSWELGGECDNSSSSGPWYWRWGHSSSSVSAIVPHLALLPTPARSSSILVHLCPTSIPMIQLEMLLCTLVLPLVRSGLIRCDVCQGQVSLLAGLVTKQKHQQLYEHVLNYLKAHSAPWQPRW